jgi:formamidopyrimidine-DNA glycosylase
MPELPDITVYIRALEERVLQRKLVGVRVSSPFVVRTVAPPISDAAGKTVIELRRLGKQIIFGLGEPDGAAQLFIVVHLMISGRFHWKPPGAKLPSKLALAAFDFENGVLMFTEAATKKRASIHVVAGEQQLEDFDRGGLDVMSASPAAFASALRRENHTIKRALTDPRLLSGIGNAYSDEILHRAGMSPFKQTNQFSDIEFEQLLNAVRIVMSEWIERFDSERKGGFPEKVTAFRPEMAVHGRYGKPCPRCGDAVQRISYADNEANYCATCQTSGKLLADRGLSRLLKSDWPRTLAELESKRRGDGRDV